jgi:hypothetical protein
MKKNTCVPLLLLTACFTFHFAPAQQKQKDIKQTTGATSITGAKQTTDPKQTKNQSETQDVPDLSKFRIHTSTAVIKVGQSANLTAQWLNDLLAPLVKEPSENTNDLLAPLVKTPSEKMSDLLAPLVQENTDSENWMTLPKASYKNIKWEIGSGAGKITANASEPVKAIFTAPLNAPNGTTYITATISGLANSPSNGANPTKAAVKLTIPIMIIKEDQYVIYSFDGKTNMVYGDGKTGVIYHKPGDEFSLKVGMSGNRELLVFTDVYTEGFFPYGNDEKKDMVAGIIINAGLAKENKKYGTSYSASTPNCHNCEERYSAGGIRITKIEEVGDEVKLTKSEEAALKNGTASEALYNKIAQQVSNSKRTYVEGTFQGVTYLQDGTDPKPIVGRFRVMAW